MAKRLKVKRMWKDSHLSALRIAFKPSNLSSKHRSLITPSDSIPRPRKSNVVALESESDAQKRVFKFLRLNKILSFAIPNGADVSDSNRQTLVAEGMEKGVPDFCLPKARGKYHGLFIEMKREDGGAGLSVEQKKWIEHLLAEEYLALCCKGFDDAYATVKWYLGLGGL